MVSHWPRMQRSRPLRPGGGLGSALWCRHDDITVTSQPSPASNRNGCEQTQWTVELLTVSHGLHQHSLLSWFFCLSFTIKRHRLSALCSWFIISHPHILMLFYTSHFILYNSPHWEAAVLLWKETGRNISSNYLTFEHQTEDWSCEMEGEQPSAPLQRLSVTL